ncbi:MULTISPECIES: hypothetical protein [Basfia]|uniref:Uncharacterized protein n=1 Tax=Mannheimia succiniciproducens (strain KCTC 0769BP / MBEL55E) TaxID=221988 RepID=Q65US4_MANSM|nr:MULTISPECIES: hypothetical protein [Basfia]AAU37286.1 unknown [[Mannheimia] succiniciproducens MBEL55E]
MKTKLFIRIVSLVTKNDIRPSVLKCGHFSAFFKNRKKTTALLSDD